MKNTMRKMMFLLTLVLTLVVSTSSVDAASNKVNTKYYTIDKSSSKTYNGSVTIKIKNKTKSAMKVKADKTYTIKSNKTKSITLYKNTKVKVTY